MLSLHSGPQRILISCQFWQGWHIWQRSDHRFALSAKPTEQASVVSAIAGSHEFILEQCACHIQQDRILQSPHSVSGFLSPIHEPHFLTHFYGKKVQICTHLIQVKGLQLQHYILCLDEPNFLLLLKPRRVQQEIFEIQSLQLARRLLHLQKCK